MPDNPKSNVTNEQLSAFFAEHKIIPVVGGAGYGANGFDIKLQLALRSSRGDLGSFLVDISTGTCTDNLGDRLPHAIFSKLRYELTSGGTYFPEVQDAYADKRNLCTAQMTRKPRMEQRPTL